MKTPNATHTPMPWTLSEVTKEQSEFQALIGNQEEGWVVAGIYRHPENRFNGKDYIQVNTAERKARALADAAHIVKCVNSHEELLAALKGAQSVIRKALPFLPADKEALYTGEWLDEINEVVARAEGGI